MTKTLLKGGLIISAEASVYADVLIQNEEIIAIGSDLDEEGVTVVDVSGKVLLPGLIDSHTHLSMPTSGTVTIDDFESGTQAALAGGTTTIIDFAIQQNGSLLEGLDVWKKKAHGSAFIDYGFHLSITDASERAIEEIADLVEAGVPSFKLFLAFPGAFQVDDGQLLKVLNRTRETGGLVQVHAENGDAIEVLIQQRLDAGLRRPMDHALSRPAILEAEATSRGVEIAKVAERPIFFVHVSSGDADAVIRKARQDDIPVLGETCTHYLSLTIDDVAKEGFEGAKYICSPPLRTVQDQELLWKSLRHEVLEIVTTDHCAFNMEQKKLGIEDFSLMPNGLPTIQFRLAILYGLGVNTGKISWNDLVRISSTNPAKVFGLSRKGAIQVGNDADIVIFDPNGETSLSAASGYSRSGYSVFEGMNTPGSIEKVYSRGDLVFERGQILAKKGRGRFIHRELGLFGPGSMTRKVQLT